MPTPAETAHRKTAPQVPSAPMEKPSDAIRKPGLHRAMTNPSHQRSAFSRCRSSTYASAIWAPPFTPGKRCLARSDRRVYMCRTYVTPPLLRAPACIGRPRDKTGRMSDDSPEPGAFCPIRTVPGRLQCGDARCTDHRPLRLRRDRVRPVRAAVGVRELPPPLEHQPDPGRGVLGDHARHAQAPHHRDPDRAGPGDTGRRPVARPRDPAADPAPGADELLVPVLHASVSAAGQGAGLEPAPVEAAPRVM